MVRLCHLLCLLGVFLSSLTPACFAFQYQHDTDEECADKVDDCAISDTLWYACPITCAEHYAKDGSMSEVHEDPEDFFQLQVTKASTGKQMALEDMEGYVTVYAIVPLRPGMAQFYYELLEHVQTIFPFTVELLVLPYACEKNQDTPPTIELKLSENRKAIVLETASRPTNVMDYFANAELVAGNEEKAFHTDRVTTFLVSSDGMFVERLISPTMTLLERRIAVFLKHLSFNAPEL